MGNTKAPHHRGTYQRRAAKVVAAAYANPDHHCWRCNRTLQQVRTTKPQARWTAGHVNAGEIDGLLLAECSPCNYSHGARLANHRRNEPHSEQW